MSNSTPAAGGKFTPANAPLLPAFTVLGGGGAGEGSDLRALRRCGRALRRRAARSSSSSAGLFDRGEHLVEGVLVLDREDGGELVGDTGHDPDRDTTRWPRSRMHGEAAVAGDEERCRW